MTRGMRVGGEDEIAIQMQYNDGGFDIAYEVVAPHIVLGGIGNKTAYSLSFSLATSAEKVTKALLDIVLSTKNERLRRWKIELSGVVLTREFKPQICKKYSSGYVCKIIFDVTPIIRSKSSDNYLVNILYPDINNEINLLHIGLLTIINEEKAHTKYVYLTEPLILNPNEEVTIRLPFRLENASIKMTVSIPHSSANLIILTNNEKITISGYQGSLEYSNSLRRAETLTLTHIGKSSYFPKEIIVSSMLIYSSTAPKPVINAEVKRIDSKSVEVVLENKGDGAASNVIVINIAAGNIIDRKVIGSIYAKEKRAVVINIDPNYLNIIRVIWRFKDETHIIEKKIKMI